MSRSKLGYGVGVALSLGVHVSAAWLLVQVAPGPGQPTSRAPIEIEIHDGEGASGPGADGERSNRVPGALLAGSPDTGQALDVAEKDGRGGDGRSQTSIVRLMARVDPVLLEDSPANATDVSQVQRIRTAPHRRSPEDRRATPNPHDDHFLASGRGGHRIRREPSERDARRGAPHARKPSRRASPRRQARHEARADNEGTPTASARSEGVSEEPGSKDAADDTPERGTFRGKGTRRSKAAAVAHGRPPVDRGPAATPSRDPEPTPSDDMDSEQLVASAKQSRTRASPQAAALQAPGRGGALNGSDMPSRGSGAGRGARGRAHAPGSGRHGALDTDNPRYLHWFVQQRDRVANVLTYPKERALGMDQGTSVFRLWIGRDGRLVQPPRLIRSSGFDDLDEAALAAIRRSTPFHPMPEQLAPSRTRISVLMPIEFINPMIR